MKLVRKKVEAGAYRLVDAVNPHRTYAFAYLIPSGGWHWSLPEGITFKDKTKPTEGRYDLLIVLINKVNAMINQYGVDISEEEE
jgi:hypothetical protein